MYFNAFIHVSLLLYLLALSENHSFAMDFVYISSNRDNNDYCLSACDMTDCDGDGYISEAVTTSEILSESDSEDVSVSLNTPPFTKKRPPQLDTSLLNSLPDKESFSFHKKESCRIFKIAIIGGGGAGSIISSILSNIATESEDVRFVITIFERNPHIINGSTFEIAAVLHAGGYEYSQDEETTAECRLAGGLFKNMFPGLYSAPSQPIVFAAASGSDLSPKIQKETQQKALSLNFERVSHSEVDSNSPREIRPKIIQSMYSSNLAGGIASTKDRKMNVLERDALIKKHIKDSPHIIVKNNVTVHRISKDIKNQFEIIYKDGSKDESTFDHVILTVWDQTNAILEASCDSEDTSYAMWGSALDSEDASDAMWGESSTFPHFSAAPRVVALCDIRRVPKLHKTPIFIMPDGAMFMPLNDDVAIAYRCARGASYPEIGANTIDYQYLRQHAQKIIDDVKEIFGRTDGTEAPLKEMTLLGARLQTIVTRSGVHLSKRRYEPPIVTPEGIIVAIPPKATFIGSLALQTIEQLLMKLPESCSTFKRKWIQEIKKIVPSNDCLYKEAELPEAFTIVEKTELSEEDIEQENLLYMEGCQLNKAGEAMRENYGNECGESLPERHRAQSIGDFDCCPGMNVLIASPAFKIIRSISDPYAEQVRRKSLAMSNACSPYLFELKMLHHERLYHERMRGAEVCIA